MKKKLLFVLPFVLGACESLPPAVQEFTKNTVDVFTPASTAPQIADLPTGDVSRVAFGSCVDETREQSFWNVIRKQNPDLFLFVGDNVYADIQDGERLSEPSAEAIARSYEIMGDNDDFRRFQRRVPMMVTWDDHDYGLNDAGEEFPLKQESKELMFDFFGVEVTDPARSRDGVYHARIFGDEGRRLQVIMLDTRWWRSPLKPTDERGAKGKERYLPDGDPSKTMLGEAQWAWLEEELKKPADVRLLVSSQQVIAEGHGWEAWHNLPKERQRLYDMIERTGAAGVVMLSGDRHVGGIYENSVAASYPLIEMTSSSLNLAFNNEPDETGPYQVGQLYGPANFGMVEVDWGSRTVFLKLHSVDGQEVRGLTVPIETLRKPLPSRIER